MQAMSIWNNESPDQQVDLVGVTRRLRVELEKSCPTKVGTLHMKKLSSWYSAGFPGSANFRKSVFKCETLPETFDLAINYFDSVKDLGPEDTSGEHFLMGGHG